jgi:hypothetical protein
MEIRSFASTIFVGSPWSVCLLLRSSIPWYNGSAGWLTAMLVIWTPKQPPWGQRAFIPRSCNTLVWLWSRQPSWAPHMCDLLSSVCSHKPCQPALDTQDFYAGNEGLPVGCAPSGPAKYLWVLGRFRLETFLRSACLGWPCQTPCSYAGYMDVSTLHTFKINITLQTSSFDAPFKTWLGTLGY